MLCNIGGWGWGGLYFSYLFLTANIAEIQMCFTVIGLVTTVKFLSFGTDRHEQIMHTLSEISDQGLHCLLLHLHLVDASLHNKTRLFDFQNN